MSWLFKNKKKEPEENVLIILHLNAWLMPMDRGEIFEDNIDTILPLKRLFYLYPAMPLGKIGKF